MKKLQLGVIGSMADTKMDRSLKLLAKGVGEEIAKQNAILVFGFEGDFASLPLFAALEAEKAGGETLAFIWGSSRQGVDGLKSLRIFTGQQRGGGREFSFVLSCDAIISLCGGSGTLMEIAMAYQAGIPIIVLKNSGGWSKKLADTFLDERKRQKIISVNSPKEAVILACQVAKRV